MQCTDACVFPYPAGDSSLRRMALCARELGFDSIVAAGSGSGQVLGIEVIGMAMAGGVQEGTVQGETRVTGGEERTIAVASAGTYTTNRALLRSGKVLILRGIADTPRNSFDHILSRMAAERGVALDIDLSLLVSERGMTRQRAIQRYADIVRFSGKFGFPLTLSSGARSILEMRSPREMAVLGRLCGLGKEEAEDALRTVSRLLSPRRAVEVVG